MSDAAESVVDSVKRAVGDEIARRKRNTIFGALVLLGLWWHKRGRGNR